MYFVLHCTDKPGRQELRLATRPSHLAYLQTYQSRIVLGGPLLDADGRPCGSLLIIDVNDRAEAEGFAAGDPYAKSELFESVLIRAFREVVRDGEIVD